ncbi:MAG: glutathione peroxidase [Planctomycetota bacterium]|nr:MAG: glutathione peroxidase [Planctomycetota bacterium]
MKVSSLCCLACVVLFGGVLVSADEKKGDVPALLKHEMKSLTGKKVDLAKYKGKVLLIVNVASQCGATPQYKPLEALHEKYHDKGLAVLGFPCNQFGEQEPGSDKEVAEFCQKNYGVKFDMFSKVDVNGDKAAELFKQLTSKETLAKDAGPVKWNFEKFLISKEGKVVGRFRTGVEPDSDEVVKAIEAELVK